MRLVDVYRGGKVAAGAIEFLYEVLRERPPEANISHTELPPIEKHRQFVIRRPYRAWYIIENEDGERVGSVYLTERNEVGIFVLKRFQGRGYARRAIIKLMQLCAPLSPIPSIRAGCFLAHVNPANKASIALFESLGAKHIANTYELSVP